MSEQPLPDKTVVQCNYRVGTAECAADARAYVDRVDWTGRRVHLLVRSRSGRWIWKWENPARLVDFRYKRIPDGHPLYGRVPPTKLSPDGLRQLGELADAPLGNQGG
jgi:hypothetical protein